MTKVKSNKPFRPCSNGDLNVRHHPLSHRTTVSPWQPIPPTRCSNMVEHRKRRRNDVKDLRYPLPALPTPGTCPSALDADVLEQNDVAHAADPPLVPSSPALPAPVHRAPTTYTRILRPRLSPPPAPVPPRLYQPSSIPQPYARQLALALSTLPQAGLGVYTLSPIFPTGISSWAPYLHLYWLHPQPQHLHIVMPGLFRLHPPTHPLHCH